MFNFMTPVKQMNKGLLFHFCKNDIDHKVISKLSNSEQSYKGEEQTHNYIDRQHQSTTGKL